MTDAIGGGGAVSSDSLIDYCNNQLSSIDGEIDTTMDSDQNAAQISQQLQGVIESLQQNSTGVNNDATTCTNLETALNGVITNMQATDPTNPNLGPMIQTYNNMVESGTGPTTALPYIDEADHEPVSTANGADNTYGSDEISSFTTTLQSASSSLDSGSEMNLVQLQSLMSQRETAISLTTNLLQALGNQANSIASNIGH
jgi:hypothetical protein